MALAGLATALGAALVPLAAAAHPHVFVTTRETVVFDAEGRVAAIKNAWTFDEYYTAFLEQGLTKGPNGRYSRETLAELAKTNTEGLTDADYFTFIKVNGRNVKFDRAEGILARGRGQAADLALHLAARRAGEALESLRDARLRSDLFRGLRPAQGADVVKLEGEKPGCSLLVRKPPQNDALKQALAALDVTQQPSLEDAGAAFADFDPRRLPVRRDRR